ncbi:MAG: hypothetical protein MZW92_05655 [Comamonadaceae bacterium]|nr:hypothetical protein [Comamonadaceae bacterium]
MRCAAAPPVSSNSPHRSSSSAAAPRCAACAWTPARCRPTAMCPSTAAIDWAATVIVQIRGSAGQLRVPLQVGGTLAAPELAPAPSPEPSGVRGRAAGHRSGNAEPLNRRSRQRRLP